MPATSGTKAVAPEVVSGLANIAWLPAGFDSRLQWYLKLPAAARQFRSVTWWTEAVTGLPSAEGGALR